MRNGLVAALGAAGAGLGTAAIFGPWWWVAGTGVLNGTPLSYYGELGFSGGSGYFAPVYSEMSLTAALLRGAAEFLVIGLLAGGSFAALSVMSKPAPWVPAASAILGGLAFMFTLLAPVCVTLLLPSSQTRDLWSPLLPRNGLIVPHYTTFWGSWSQSTSTSTLRWSCGAGWAWYFALGASCLFLAGTVLLLLQTRLHANRGGHAPAPLE